MLPVPCTSLMRNSLPIALMQRGGNECAHFWDSIAGFVSRDGWTANETYDQVLEKFAELREEGLKSLGGETVAFEARTR
jgi:hypothetical protein